MNFVEFAEKPVDQQLAFLLGLDPADAEQLTKVIAGITKRMKNICDDVQRHSELHLKARCNASCLSGRYAVHPSGQSCPLHGCCVVDRLRAYVRDGEREMVVQAMSDQREYVKLQKHIQTCIGLLNEDRQRMYLRPWRPEGWFF